MPKHEHQHLKIKKSRAHHVNLERRGLAPIFPEVVLRYGIEKRKRASLIVSILIMTFFYIYSHNFRYVLERVMPYKEVAHKSERLSQLTEYETIRYAYSDKLPKKPGRYVIYSAANSKEERAKIEVHNNDDGYVHPSSRVINMGSLYSSYEDSSSSYLEQTKDEFTVEPEEVFIQIPENSFTRNSALKSSTSNPLYHPFD